MRSGSIPRLYAVTRPLPRSISVDTLITLADPHHPLLWLRDGRGCVGIGELTRITAAGPGRFTEAASAWSALLEEAEIDDPVQLPGSGPLAFGSFAFADASASSSVLIVPRLIIARDDEQAWITVISNEPITADPGLPPPRAIGSWPGAQLAGDTPDAAYSAGVARATTEIAAGLAEKIVLARRVHGSFNAGDDVRVPLSRLATRYLDCWTFAIDGLVGASPETLIRRTDGVVSARILAGTRPRATSPDRDHAVREELLADSKEQLEHALAVQSVVDALTPFVEELRVDQQPFALELPNVWHLASDLTARATRTGSSLDLAGALHPTAAVAGTPTDVAIRAISRLEGFDRERYAGAVGWIDSHGDGEWVIALRCAQLGEAIDSARSITAYAGGGILAESDPEREFVETVSKLQPIIEAFGPESTGLPSSTDFSG